MTRLHLLQSIFARGARLQDCYVILVRSSMSSGTTGLPARIAASFSGYRVSKIWKAHNYSDGPSSDLLESGVLPDSPYPPVITVLKRHLHFGRCRLFREEPQQARDDREVIVIVGAVQDSSRSRLNRELHSRECASELQQTLVFGLVAADDDFESIMDAQVAAERG